MYRLMGFLCEALVELSDHRKQLLDLLEAIQALPPSDQIDWPRLPGFGNMWADLYRLHMHGHDHWETSETPLTDTRKRELCRHEEAVAAAEADMFLRGVGGVTARWGYEWLSLVHWQRPGMAVFMRGAYVWLAKAGGRLKDQLEPDKVSSYGHPSRVKAAMPEHWEAWRWSFLRISEEVEAFAADDREVAGECYKLMET
ncbi:hypothetical protein JDV02_009740 [Purpureocillium takamizusanense]|uniref:Uncharacterized protein n=1 Tax=Purpureocillium takamizusanense TaxID=2060973 RepID=A0A9Q8QPF3_9HYPO|nr:uncharacterized protein JDV02_009740 [Purpureocillium takamizusanense]UNI23953.1 hypothetical protein JDV02_009740 [Purpureocillium takamizusanense]